MGVRKLAQILGGLGYALGVTILALSLDAKAGPGPGDQPKKQYRREKQAPAADNSSDSSSNDNANIDLDEAAMLIACNYKTAPARGSPFSGDDVIVEWGWPSGSDFSDYTFEFRSNSSYHYKNPVCERFVMAEIMKQTSSVKQLKSRCEYIKDDLGNDATSGSNSGGSGFLDSPFPSGAHGGGANSAKICKNYDENSNVALACAYTDFKDSINDSSGSRQVANQIINYCRKIGADMGDDGYARAGIDAYGSPCGSRGGVTVVRSQNNWVDTLANTTLGLAKIGLPLLALNAANRRHEANVNLAERNDYKLGFPSAVTAGGQTQNLYGGGYGLSGQYGGYGSVGGGYASSGYCGVPPYLSTGCGSSIYGPTYGVNGGAGLNFGATGYGNPYGAGASIGYSPYGQNIYGGAGASPYGALGYGNIGANPFGAGGQYGTLNGAAGLGNVGLNAQYASQQAAAYAQYAQQIAKSQADQANLARLYNQQMQDAQSINSKATQTYSQLLSTSAGTQGLNGYSGYNAYSLGQQAAVFPPLSGTQYTVPSYSYPNYSVPSTGSSFSLSGSGFIGR